MVSNKSGGIKVANNLATTEKGFALDARQGKALDEKIKEVLEWKFIGMFDLETDAFRDISIPDTAHEIWFIIGYKNDTQVYGGVSAVMPKYQSDRNIVAFGDVYDGSGEKIASKVRGYYTDNILKVRVREIVGNYHIAARVYYR